MGPFLQVGLLLLVPCAPAAAAVASGGDAPGSRSTAPSFSRRCRRKRATTRAPQGPPLFFDHTEWFRAYLETVGLSTEQVPISCELSVVSRQDAWVEYRRQHVAEGRPDLAVLETRLCEPLGVEYVPWPESHEGTGP